MAAGGGGGRGGCGVTSARTPGLVGEGDGATEEVLVDSLAVAPSMNDSVSARGLRTGVPQCL